MSRFTFIPRSTKNDRKPDSFERSRRTRGGSARSYTEGVHQPSRKKEEKQRLILMAAVSVLLPPVGVIILWRTGIFRFPVRIAATFLAFLLMVLYFSWMIPEEEPAAYQPPVQRPSAVTEYATPEADDEQQQIIENMPLY